LYKAAKPLLKPVEFSNKLDFTWYELWHHEGRRARHGASMMGPDYTHWHGTYEVAKAFYSEYVPQLEELIAKGRKSENKEQVAAAEALAAKLEQVLNGENHRWFLDRMDPAEKERRQQQTDEFKKRYTR
jgi:hydroxylamine dehydrogenase